VGKFRIVGMTVTNQNYIHREVKDRLNLGNPCHYSVQNVSCFCFLYRNPKIKMYRSIVVPIVLPPQGKNIEGICKQSAEENICS